MELYIFGAGASAAEGAPATRNLLARAYEYLSPAFDERVVTVWRFLEQVFERPITGPASFDLLPPVDEVLSLVDWSLHVDTGLGPHYDPPRLYQVRQALEYLLCTTLDEAQQRSSSPEEGPHRTFARRLADRPPGSFALLSLNYDTLLDDALLAAGHTPDYGLHPLSAGGEELLLLKLHGSLNWAHCPACDQIEVVSQQVAHLLPRVEGLACSRCGNRRLAGVIISPTLLKRYTPPGLGRVFDQALQVIRQARRILVIGYSLPTADVAIHHLLRRGLLTRMQPEPPRVEVINHRPSTSLIRRYRQLFGAEVSFDFSGFHGQV